jgi:hypothetical protein
MGKMHGMGFGTFDHFSFVYHLAHGEGKRHPAHAASSIAVPRLRGAPSSDTAAEPVPHATRSGLRVEGDRAFLNLCIFKAQDDSWKMLGRLWDSM